MHPHAVHLIMEEHRALAAVLHALRDAVGHAGKSARPPDFDALRAMLFYLDEMPARVHHATEGDLLFPRIRERCPVLRPVLDRLEAEQARGESAVRELEHALTAWEVMGSARRESFALLLNAFSERYLGHMEVEENYVLPVALDYLCESDWQELEQALSRQRGALTESLTRSHRELFERIITHHSPS
jgi:hemerythrin-like domain-containing protein